MAERDVVRQFGRRRRHLPHWEEPGATYFITICRHPGASIDLTADRIAPTIVGALRHFDEDRYWLYDYTVMPDHVHVVLKPIVRDGAAERLWRILQSLKAWTARRINEVAQRSGSVWQHESYDHIIRDQADYEIKASYIFENPSTKGLIDDPAEWPWWGRGRGP